MVATIEQPDVITRDQVALEDTWDLSTIYPTDGAWDTAVEALRGQLADVTSFRGRLGESAERLAEGLVAAMTARLTIERLQTFAHLRRDEDTTDAAANARYERSAALATEAAEALAFIEPELLALPAEQLAEFAAQPALKPYVHMLDDVQRRRPHVRSIEVEEVLAQQADALRAPHDAFSALDNADLEYGQVHDERGAEITLTKARHGVLMRAKDRGVRQEAHETMAKAYQAHRYTLAALHSASVRTDVYRSKVRGYDSARHAALFEDNIPETVYDNLVSAVRDARPVLERWLGLRQRILGLDQLAIHDLGVPLSPEPERQYSYQEAVDIVLGGLAPLGERYVADLRGGFASRWVDVYETKGKRSGAYSWGVYGAPPVILMNWNGTITDVFTLAHEAGHAMHSFYANQAQPYHDASYTIFLAEIASTVNETLLTWHMLDATPETDRLGRFALLNRFADAYYATVVRQTMFADFEHRTHGLVEEGQPLTLETLNDLYAEVYDRYAPRVTIDDLVRIQWSRIPHFYRAFYVFQYATGLSAAVTLARAIHDGGDNAAERYLAMLAAGGSDYSLPVLQRAGVDLTSREPIEIGLAEFARVVGEMEALVDQGALSSQG